MKRDDLIMMASAAGLEELMGVDPVKLDHFAQLIASAERVEAELRCANTLVLLNGRHGYAALNVQKMIFPPGWA